MGLDAHARTHAAKLRSRTCQRRVKIYKLRVRRGRSAAEAGHLDHHHAVRGDLRAWRWWHGGRCRGCRVSRSVRRKRAVRALWRCGRAHLEVRLFAPFPVLAQLPAAVEGVERSGVRRGVGGGRVNRGGCGGGCTAGAPTDWSPQSATIVWFATPEESSASSSWPTSESVYEIAA